MSPNLHSLLFLILSLSIASTSINSKPITIDLHHKDSTSSPPHITHHSHQQRFDQLFRLDDSNGALTGSVYAANGQYQAKISIGSPPFKFHGIVDSGSDLLWTQCLPCELCYNQTGPEYNPSKSSTAKDLPCNSNQCKLLSSAFCTPGRSRLCDYTYGYGAGLSKGVLKRETFRFGGASIPNVVFGCARNTTGNWDAASMAALSAFFPNSKTILAGKSTLSVSCRLKLTQA